MGNIHDWYKTKTTQRSGQDSFFPLRSFFLDKQAFRGSCVMDTVGLGLGGRKGGSDREDRYNKYTVILSIVFFLRRILNYQLCS